MDLEFRPIRSEDEPGGSAERSWLRAANPAGTHTLAAFQGDRRLASATLVQRRVWAVGKERCFGELVGLEGSRELVLVLRGLLDAHGGPAGATVVYGRPDATHGKLLGRMLGFETVRSETLLLRELDGGADGSDAPRAAPADVERLARFDDDARWLFERCSGEFGAAAIRDASYLNWRFCERPERDYVVLGVRDAERVLRGYAVLARGTSLLAGGTGEEWALADWLVPPAEAGVGELLLRGALAEVRAARGRRLVLLLPEWSPWFDVFQTWGFLVAPARSFLLAKSSTRRFDDLWLRESWWTTLSDWFAV